ncbi:MAG TPA: hypothetical protein VHT21_05335 [Stellaceae bacterium]|jgi:hypothetical protein|nr:hypothetical protein [Stellaceae bacterium]
MRSAECYRRRQRTRDGQAVRRISNAAQDYEDIAEDIDVGAVEIRHRELLPQTAVLGLHRFLTSRS